MLMSQRDLLNTISKDSSMNEVQEYLKKVIEMRGFAEESILETMLLLLEETGELAKAIRKNATSMAVDVNKMQNYDTIESEVADVFIVLVSVCNRLGMNLFECIMEKELKNCDRNWSIIKEGDPHNE